MDESILRDRIAGGESSSVEFKIKAPRPAELAERMCGRANARGGMLLFDIADDGRIVGLKKPQEAIDLILRAARIVKPAVTLREPAPDLVTLDDRTLVVVVIPPNDGTL